MIQSEFTQAGEIVLTRDSLTQTTPYPTTVSSEEKINIISVFMVKKIVIGLLIFEEWIIVSMIFIEIIQLHSTSSCDDDFIIYCHSKGIHLRCKS